MQLRNPAMMIMRLSFLTALVFTTEKLWQAIGHKGFDPVNIVWYLVMNEMLFFSYDERLQRKIFNDVRSGNIGYSLIRPFSYLNQSVIEGMGTFCARLPFLMLGGGLVAYFMTGGLPATLYGMPVIFVLMILSGLFTTFMIVFIGLLGLYMQSVNSVYLIWHKFMFVLGGLLFPLTIYPEWLQKIAAWTPFPWAVYEISRLIYEFSWSIALNTTLHLILWITVVFVMTNWLFRTLLKKVAVNGG